MHLALVRERDQLVAETSVSRLRSLAVGWGRLALAAVLVSLLGAAALAGPALATTRYTFRTLDNNNDPTFNQLLGINKSGLIAGYFGSGAQGHPNKGYLLSPPYQQRNYVNENFPKSVQTQVTGLNDLRVTVGFWSNTNNANMVNANFGFYTSDGHFHGVSFPTSTDTANPPVSQLLGVNDKNVAVGFDTEANGNTAGYTYTIRTGTFKRINISGASSVTAAAINNSGDVAGFETDSAGNVDGYLLKANGKLTTLRVPGATMTQALGVNDSDEVVGLYTVGTGSNAPMHGFTWTSRNGFQTVNDPNGVDTTTINGINDQGKLVGFYVAASGNTDGMLATPRS